MSDYIAKCLKMNNINTVYGYQGSSITHMIDSIVCQGIHYVQNYHEQSSAFCANAYAHISGNFGVAVACSGPGATNLITGIANAYYDSVPCLFITGQVSVNEMKTDLLLRQNGFQESDIVSMVLPITKYAVTIKDPLEIRYHLEKALYLLTSGRPGPVLIDIPHNIQKAEIGETALPSFFGSAEYAMLTRDENEINKECITLTAKLISESKKPLLLFGGGMRYLKDTPLLEKFICKMDMPIVVSLRGIDAIAHDNVNYYGFIGAYGNRYANLALACSDLIIVLGSRLDGRQTGGLDNFAPNAKIVHIDIDFAELNKEKDRIIPIKGSCKDFIQQLSMELSFYNLNFKQWHKKLARLKQSYPSIKELEIQKGINPNVFIDTLFKKVKASCVVAVDVGQHQMWVAQSMFLKSESYFLVSGGHGAMGYALPAIIGAAYMNLAQPLICVVGDGGIQMNLQELQMIARDNLNITIFIMNNHSLGLIREYQNMVLDGRCYGSVTGFSSPDFKKIAEAYNLDYVRIEEEADFNNIDVIYNSKATIVEVIIAENSKIAPEPTYMRPFFDQSPLVSKKELDKIINGENE